MTARIIAAFAVIAAAASADDPPGMTARFTGPIEVGQINGTAVVAGIRIRGTDSNVGILLQPRVDAPQPNQWGEKANVMWYSAGGERMTAMGPHAGSHQHFSIYTKKAPVGSGDTGLEKRLDIGFGSDTSTDADVVFDHVKEFNIRGSDVRMGVGTNVPENRLHVYSGLPSPVVAQIESDANTARVQIEGQSGFDSQILLKEGTASRWLIYSDASRGGALKIYDYASGKARLTLKPGGDTIVNVTDSTKLVVLDEAGNEAEIGAKADDGSYVLQRTNTAGTTTTINIEKFFREKFSKYITDE